MKDKINYSNCMRIKCRDCKNFDYCFGYKSPEKSNNEIRDNIKVGGDNGKI